MCQILDQLHEISCEYTDILFYIKYLTRTQERTHKGGKSSLFDRMVSQLSTAASTTTTSGTSTTSAQAAAAILRYGGLSATVDRNKDEEPVREEDGELHIAIAETMLKWHAEAVGRCVELSPASDVYVIELVICLPFLIDATSVVQNTYSPCCESWLPL